MENTLGLVGGLHVNGNDSRNHWTSLLSLSNLPNDCAAGRTLQTATRTYVEFPPKGKGVIVFRAVHPHLSIGPSAIDPDSVRKPYPFQMPENDEELDPAKYVTTRCLAVGYPKRHIMEKSPEIQRNIAPVIFKKEPENLTSTNTPDRHPLSLLAFGTRENQNQWYAMAFARNHARTLQSNPSIVPLTAAEIAHMFRYISEDGTIATPDVVRIQFTLVANSADFRNTKEFKKWEDSNRFCQGQLSQHWFPIVEKSGPVEWVKQDEIGSTFQHLDPEVSSHKTFHYIPILYLLLT